MGIDSVISMTFRYSLAVILETRHLELVTAIRKEGTLTRAAKTLHVTQPAASRTLKQLERRLGLDLFRREPKGMSLTPAGKQLLTTAGKVLGELSRAERALAELGAGQRGVLRLTTECYTCYHWLPRILASFTEDYPGVDLQIVPNATRRPLEALLEEEVDLAIVHTVPDRKDVLARELFKDELVAVLAPNHPLGDRKVLTPADFKDERLVLHTEFADSLIATDVLGPAGIRPGRVYELQLTEAVPRSCQVGTRNRYLGELGGSSRPRERFAGEGATHRGGTLQDLARRGSGLPLGVPAARGPARATR